MQRDVRYRSRKFDVIRVTRTPHGASQEHEVVAHPGAAVILPFLDDGRIVMIRNWRIAADRELLELPAGTLDPGESPADCARRELQEETGYAARTIEPLLHFYPSPGICTEVLHVFVARSLTPGSQHLDPSERITPVLMSMAQALEEIAARRIIDAKTIATLLFFERFGTARA